MQNSMEIRPIGVEMFHVDRRRDMKKLIVASRSIANKPNETHNIRHFIPTACLRVTLQ